MSELRFWVGFSLIPGIGPVRIQRLLDYFGDLALAWLADRRELARAGLDAKTVETVAARRREIDLDGAMAKIERLGLRVLTLADPAYPEPLRHIYGPPPLLYLRGELAAADQWAVAVVGTRRATSYGREVAERLAGELARAGVTIVSGLAKGIDSQAHRGALAAGGRTIAVLGSGPDVVYPAENAALARRIVEQGALVTEHPPGTPPDAANFPARNRIISGLSRGVLVVEAGETSGALITADFALDQGRDVFAVPGNIFWPTSVGTHKLIQQGAKLVRIVDDILQELHLGEVHQQLEMRQLLPENETEAQLLQLLSVESQHIDELVRRSGLPAHLVSATLTMMELKGMARHVGGMQYVAAR